MNLRPWSLCGERKLLFEKIHLILGQGSISQFPWCKFETFLPFACKRHCHYLTHRRLFKKRKKIKTLPRKGVVDIRKLLVPMTRTREKWNLPETKSSRKDVMFKTKRNSTNHTWYVMHLGKSLIVYCNLAKPLEIHNCLIDMMTWDDHHSS